MSVITLWDVSTNGYLAKSNAIMEGKIMKTKQNLDNQKPEIEEVEDVTNDLDNEVDESDLEQSPKFDDEGNLIDDELETVDQEETAEDVQEEDDNDNQDNDVKSKDKSASAKKKLSPAEVAIIELKKENKLKEKRLRDLEQKIIDQNKEKEQESGIAKYVAEGHDEETAKRYYADDQRYQELKERTEILDFREENSEVFAKYPQARNNVKQIMQVVKSGLMSAEQVCKGLFGNAVSDRETRAALAAKGESLYENKGNTLSRQDRNGSINTQEGLSVEQKREKAQLERLFKLKKPLTVQEYLNVSKL